MWIRRRRTSSLFLTLADIYRDHPGTEDSGACRDEKSAGVCGEKCDGNEEEHDAEGTAAESAARMIVTQYRRSANFYAPLRSALNGRPLDVQRPYPSTIRFTSDGFKHMCSDRSFLNPSRAIRQ